MVLHVNNLSHRYETQAILQGVNFHIKDGQIACLLGPSGCGKTTLLRCIAGFDQPQKGEIKLGGNTLCNAEANIFMPPEKRNIGVVFQDYALFPHLTVTDNIGFGIRHVNRQKRKDKIQQLLRSVDMLDFAGRMPHELSGGQQQRVALARSLATEPQLLLLDEPFSNLDPGLKERMKQELKALLKFFRVTALMVTHDQDEAFDIADEIGVMDKGRILQWGTSYELYHKPQTKIVSQFLGMGSFLPASVNEKGCLHSELGELVCESDLKHLSHQKVHVLLRPDDVIHDDEAEPIATVERIAFRGMYQVYHLRLPSGMPLQCFTSSHHHPHPVGSKIGIRLDLKHAVILTDKVEAVMERKD